MTKWVYLYNEVKQVEKLANGSWDGVKSIVGGKGAGSTFDRSGLWMRLLDRLRDFSGRAIWSSLDLRIVAARGAMCRPSGPATARTILPVVALGCLDRSRFLSSPRASTSVPPTG